VDTPSTVGLVGQRALEAPLGITAAIQGDAEKDLAAHAKQLRHPGDRGDALVAAAHGALVGDNAWSPY
jgi:hypothetical protein